MMTLPILCFDLDGTLLDHDGRLHPEDVRLLTRAGPPAVFIPATGRSLASVRQSFLENNLFAGSPLPFPLVLQNGSLLYLPGEIEAGYFPFSPATQASLYELAKTFPMVTFFWLTQNAVYTLHENAFGRQYARRYKFDIQPFVDTSLEAAISKLMCISPDPRALKSVARAAKGLEIEGGYSMATIYEINAQGVSKANGIRRLLECLELGGRPFFAAGDGENDRAMLEAAALAFAPVSSPAPIRSLAQHVIDVPRRGLFAPMLEAIHT